MNTVQQLEYIKKITRWDWKTITEELNKGGKIVDPATLSNIRSTGTPEQKHRIEQLYNKTKKKK